MVSPWACAGARYREFGCCHLELQKVLAMPRCTLPGLELGSISGSPSPSQSAVLDVLRDVCHLLPPGSHVDVPLGMAAPAQPRGEGHRELLGGQAQPPPSQRFPDASPSPGECIQNVLCVSVWVRGSHPTECSCLLPCWWSRARGSFSPARGWLHSASPPRVFSV